ncbi:Adenine DNA glycosylase like protein [Verticillium longisporum]|nr:Adenine DNA glycosylase like protein [Verticillium longisporum]
MMRRQSSLAAARKISVQAEADSSEPEVKPAPMPIPSSKAKTRSRPLEDASPSTTNSKPEQSDDGESEEPKPKRRKTAVRKKSSNAPYTSLFTQGSSSPSSSSSPTAVPPLRSHALSYHRPLLLDSASHRRDLLTWFDSVSTTRQMPWRKPFLPPPVARADLERRAYEVWISEIMLQQTRVAVVIDYWNRWTGKWPTIQDLAAASPDDVLSAWRGLGYYSRATRIHEAARLVVADDKMQGMLPEDVAELESKVPGVGRYTAGAISAIVFGHAAPMVDGNVLRVLSRQLGVFGNVKTDKTTIDMLWAAADALVKAVARDGDTGSSHDDQPPVSDRPGRWGQALMELGSTICTPKPDCAQCPITASCRAYAEGLALADQSKAARVPDIEDSCTLCESFADLEAEPAVAEKPVKKGAKQGTLSAFFNSSSTKAKSAPNIDSKPTQRQMETVVEHARKFPLKVIKKAVREEDTLVCAIRRADGCFLLHKRPEKGLLAGLWELPSKILPDGAQTSSARVKMAKAHVASLLGKQASLKHAGELGTVPWLFSHLKLTMHVHLFDLSGPDTASGDERWATSDEVEAESMGTGMRKCWALVQDHDV